jgi:predicted DNA-binding transcriptional regulator YafY
LAIRDSRPRERAESIRQRLFVDTAGWRGTTENLSMLSVVQEAVSRDRKLAIEYRRRVQEIVERVIDPLGLVAKGSTWYLVAQTEGGLRTYRVSRIEKARLLDVPSARPANFDLEQYWKASTKEFRDGWSRFEAVLRLAPSAAREMRLWRAATPIERLPGPDWDGWETLRVQFQSEDEACFVVMGMGPVLDVLEPAALRERVVTTAAAVLERARKLAGAAARADVDA